MVPSWGAVHRRRLCRWKRLVKAVLLAGGFGTRLSEETDRIPKPMVTIGNRPILWHIMKLYSQHGINDFVICAGYKSHVIVRYFANYREHNSNVTVDLASGIVTCLNEATEPWKISIIDTGEGTETGGRIKRVRDYLSDDEPFCLTYGDGIADVDIGALIKFHKDNEFTATLTAVRPPARFGAAIIENDRVTSFTEKPASGEGHINGGFFVVNPSALDLIEGDKTVWERAPLETLAREGKLGAFVHDGFWRPMDTLRDQRVLEDLWDSGQAPWKWWR
jgi:glucose-1-phosphate cytidylyltransferase